jgi:NADH:ubiquinone oxidoreductase subunit F (NADH-binding)
MQPCRSCGNCSPIYQGLFSALPILNNLQAGANAPTHGNSVIVYHIILKYTIIKLLKGKKSKKAGCRNIAAARNIF